MSQSVGCVIVDCILVCTLILASVLVVTEVWRASRCHSVGCVGVDCILVCTLILLPLRVGTEVCRVSRSGSVCIVTVVAGLKLQDGTHYIHIQYYMILFISHIWWSYDIKPSLYIYTLLWWKQVMIHTHI